MSALKDLSLGARTLALRPRLLLAAWLLHLTFALAASWFPWREIIGSLEHRPAASRAFLQGFDLELLVDWMAAYGKPVAAYQNAALVMALYLKANQSLMAAVAFGFAVGSCWVATSFGVNYLFERKSLRLFFINAGYVIVQFTVMGLVLGLFL